MCIVGIVDVHAVETLLTNSDKFQDSHILKGRFSVMQQKHQNSGYHIKKINSKTACLHVQSGIR